MTTCIGNLAVAGDIFDGVLFCAVFFSHEMSLMRSWTEVSQFLRLFLPTLITFVVKLMSKLVNVWLAVLKVFNNRNRKIQQNL